MARYVLGRLLSILFVLLVVSMITFALMHSVPGGPFDETNQPLPPAAKANILRKYGLDQPVWKQYINYMSNALRLDFGIPYQQPTTTVTELIARTWAVSVQLGLLTILVAFGLGIPIGVYAAYHQNSWIDNAVTFVAMLGITVPNFVIAIWLILIFAVRLDWLPMGGWNDPDQWLIPGVLSKTWIMPVLAYALAPLSVTARYTRSSVLDVIRSDFVRTARAKGLGAQTILWRHVLRNALIPMVTVLGVEIPNLLTGTIFIETIFRIPGLGKFFVTSTFNRDYPMIMALVLLIATVWGLTYLATDLLYTRIDPRIRLGSQGGA
ncbi:MAG TPA: ABC transporter permease [Caldilineaceae bacterium]|nr:ABC transporter permease [Caldilineaceae bacterium]